VAVLLDTGVLYAYYDRSDSWHRRAVALMGKEREGLVVPSPVIPEVDHLLGERLGAGARFAFYEGLAGGHYFVADLPREKYARVAELNRRFSQLELGFVDAAVVAIAESLGLPRVATTDRRDFEPMARALSLELLP
jgi:predicted nucleic acid-binding protein